MTSHEPCSYGNGPSSSSSALPSRLSDWGTSRSWEGLLSAGSRTSPWLRWGPPQPSRSPPEYFIYLFVIYFYFTAWIITSNVIQMYLTYFTLFNLILIIDLFKVIAICLFRYFNSISNNLMFKHFYVLLIPFCCSTFDILYQF